MALESEISGGFIHAENIFKVLNRDRKFFEKLEGKTKLLDKRSFCRYFIAHCVTNFTKFLNTWNPFKQKYKFYCFVLILYTIISRRSNFSKVNLENSQKHKAWFMHNRQSSITTTDSIIFRVKYLAYQWICFSYHFFREIWFQLFFLAWLMISRRSDSFSTLGKCFPLNSSSFLEWSL